MCVKGGGGGGGGAICQRKPNNLNAFKNNKKIKECQYDFNEIYTLFLFMFQKKNSCTGKPYKKPSLSFLKLKTTGARVDGQ